MSMPLQATIFTKSCFGHKGVYMPTIPSKRRGRRCSVTTNSLAAGAMQANCLSPVNNHQEVFRPLADFPSDIWGDCFTSLSLDNLEFESCSRQVEVLKKKVKGMLMAESDQVEKILFINSLCRLGVSYHFENEIEEQLSYFFVSLPKLIDDKDYDLPTVATIFQVFRSHGYRMSCDVFKKFKDDDGEFKEVLASDVKGIVSLYEACQFRINGEKLLDEALAFTMKHLESLAKQSSPHLGEYIVNALYRPYHRGMARVEARQYISFYEKEGSLNDALLKFAKFDFNRVQFLYQQELSVLLSWYKDLNIASQLSYARDRMVETFFWAIGFYFEPHYAPARNIFSKLVTTLIFIDDTYDAYGTFQELQCFTDAIQRWDISALDQLPADYLKILYRAVLNVHDEVDRVVSKEGRCYSMNFTKDELKRTVISYLVEAQWTHESYLPDFDEYLDTALETSALSLVIAQVLVGMEEADANVFEWLGKGDSKSVGAIKVIARLQDDIVTNEAEEMRGLAACGIKSYMKQHGLSKEEAIEEFRKRIVFAWNELNEDYMRPTLVPMQILKRILNIACVVDVTYKVEDGFTMSEKILKDHITKLLIEPIPI